MEKITQRKELSGIFIIPDNFILTWSFLLFKDNLHHKT